MFCQPKGRFSACFGAQEGNNFNNWATRHCAHHWSSMSVAGHVVFGDTWRSSYSDVDGGGGTSVCWLCFKLFCLPIKPFSLSLICLITVQSLTPSTLLALPALTPSLRWCSGLPCQNRTGLSISGSDSWVHLSPRSVSCLHLLPPTKTRISPDIREPSPLHATSVVLLIPLGHGGGNPSSSFLL